MSPQEFLLSRRMVEAAQPGWFVAITEKMAKEIAVQRTGYTADRVTFVKTDFEYDNGMAEYEVEFCVDGSKYDIKISPENADAL